MQGNETALVSPVETKERYDWVDCLKFLGIFAIYLGHFGNSAGLFYGFVFTYHVPLFFFAGGFFAKNKSGETLLNYIRKMCKRILIPYYSFISIEILVNSIVGNYSVDTILQLIYEGLLGRRNHVGPTWFLPCFFVIAILYQVILRITKNPFVAFIPCYLLYTFQETIIRFFHIEPLSLIYTLDSAIYYLAFFAAGNIMFPLINKWLENNPFWGGRYSVVKLLSSLGLIALTAAIYFTSHYYIVDKISLQGHFWSGGVFIQTILLILFNCIVAHTLQHLSLIRQIGSRTLVLCGFESSTKTLLTAVMAALGLTSQLTNPLTAIIYTGVCLIACYYFFNVGVRYHFPFLYKLWNG